MGTMEIDLTEEFGHKYKCRDFIPRKYQDNIARYLAKLTPKGKEYFSLLERNEKADAHVLEEQDMMMIQKMRDEIILGCVLEPKINLDSDDCNSVEIEMLSGRIQEKIAELAKKYQIIKKKES